MCDKADWGVLAKQFLQNKPLLPKLARESLKCCELLQRGIQAKETISGEARSEETTLETFYFCRCASGVFYRIFYADKAERRCVVLLVMFLSLCFVSLTFPLLTVISPFQHTFVAFDSIKASHARAAYVLIIYLHYCCINLWMR